VYITVNRPISTELNGTDQISNHSSFLFTELCDSFAVFFLDNCDVCAMMYFAALFMATLRRRCGHYIFALWFFSVFYLLLFIPRLISAVADWMSTILAHMVWPLCDFRYLIS